MQEKYFFLNAQKKLKTKFWEREREGNKILWVRKLCVEWEKEL